VARPTADDRQYGNDDVGGLMAPGRLLRHDGPPRAGQSLQVLYAHRRGEWASARRRGVFLSALWWGPAIVALGIIAGAVTHFAAFGLLLIGLSFAAAFDVAFRKPDALLLVRERASAESGTGRVLRAVEIRGGANVLHDRMLAGVANPFEVEHMVISPRGAFLIDTKHWQGGIRMFGHEMYLGHTSQEPLFKQLVERARVIGEQLTDVAARDEEVGVVTVTPVLAIHCDALAGTPRKMQGVVVVTPHQLPALMRAPDLRWSAPATAHLVEAAELLLVRKDPVSAP
jgi:hypothetical protein